MGLPLKISFTVLIVCFGLAGQFALAQSFHQSTTNEEFQPVVRGDEKYFTYEEIVEELNKETNDFLSDMAVLHRLSWKSSEGSSYASPMRRRKRSIEHHVPDSLKDGIWPLTQVTNAESMLFNQNDDFIDMQVLRFNDVDFLLTLTSRNGSHFVFQYGPIFQNRSALEVKLGNPKKILAFINPNSPDKLAVFILNEKRQHEDVENLMWFHLETNPDGTLKPGEIYFRHEMKRVAPQTSTIWPDSGKMFLHDIGSDQLNVIDMKGTVFDKVSHLDVTPDLNLVYSFNFQNSPFLLLAYRSYDPFRRPNDVRIMGLNAINDRLEEKQTIQVSEEVIDAHYFYYGSPLRQDNFLVFVKQHHIVFYKLAQTNPLRFLTFQRIRMENVAKVVPYGDEGNLFVMVVISKTHDVTFITYNSFRFLVSNVQRRVFFYPENPIRFYRQRPEESEPTVRMLVARKGGIDSFRFVFTHDTSLLESWIQNINWCNEKRNEVGRIEIQHKNVSEIFSQSYLKTDPFVVRGNLTVSSVQYINATVEAQEYYQRGLNHLQVDANYFQELYQMEKILHQIDQEINIGHLRLEDAVLINAKDIQKLSGNLRFKNVRFNKYSSAEYHEPHHVKHAPMNLVTNHLNGFDVRNLFEDTVRLRDNNQRTFIETLRFERIDMHPSALLRVDALTNDHFRLSDVVTRDGDHVISGAKRFHNCLLVDDNIYVHRVNRKSFNATSVLLTSVEQTIFNPVTIRSKIRANVAKANYVNGHHLRSLFGDIVRKDELTQIASPVEFANGLDVYNLVVNGSARLNGHIIDEVLEDVVWKHRANQTLWGEYYFHSNVHIDGNLFVERVNHKNIPDDLVLANQRNVIKSQKRFDSLVLVDRLDVTNDLNGLQVVNGMPDILLKYHPQNVTGSKVVLSVHASNHSVVAGGKVNEMNLQELLMQSKQRPQTRQYERLHVENFADFKGGLIFERFNSLSRAQFDQLMQHSVGLDQSWDHLNLGEVRFANLLVNTLDCKTINGLQVENDLLTRNTTQTITGAYAFNDVLFEADSSIQSINNFSMQHLNNVFRTYGNQDVGSKTFGSDIFVKSLKAKSINEVPTEEIVFMDEVKSKTITGVKHFKGQNLQFDYLTVDDINVPSINNIGVQDMMRGTLRRIAPQNIPGHIRFQTLQLGNNEDFRTLHMNGVDLRQLQHDLVLNIGHVFQNVTGTKVFTGATKFEDISFTRFFEGITQWQMHNDWMIQGASQKVDSTFTIENMEVRNVMVHDAHLNGIDLNQMDQSVVRLDRKTRIHSQLVFVGSVDVEGDILLNGRLNQIDLRKDVVYSNFNGIQTIRGQIHLLGNVTVYNNVDVNGRINDIKVEQVCASAYRPNPNVPLVINGDVRVMTPLHVNIINNITYNELRYDTIQHNLKNQKINGRLIVNTLVLNGAVHLSQRINNVKLEEIFHRYLSKTVENQVVNAEIVLQSDRETVFADNVLVNGNFDVENGMVGDINLAHIDENALKVYGDQQILGNIEFAADVTIDLNLNAQYINDVNTDYLMRKNRTVYSFLEETLFTRGLTVADTLNIVNGKRVAGVNVELMRNTAVRKGGSKVNSTQNHKVRGMKIFESVNVEVIHTEKLNKVDISKRNLLLRTDSQTITGQISFAGNVIVNKSVVNNINGLSIIDFNKTIAKKSERNVIDSPVHFDRIDARTVEVHALIDNVNISVLKPISDTVNNLHTLATFAANEKRRFELFEKHLSFVAPKFLFFEHFHSVFAKNLGVEHIDKPLVVESILQHLVIYLKSPLESDCFGVQVFVKDESNNEPWHRLTLYSPAPVFWTQQMGKYVFMASQIGPNGLHSNVAACLSRNTLSDKLEPNPLNLPAGILFQVFTLFPTIHSSLLVHRTHFEKTLKTPKVLPINDSRRMVICAEQSCFLVCLLCGGNVELASFRFDSPIRKVSSYKNTILVATRNNQVNILKSFENKLVNIQPVPATSVKSMLIVDNNAINQAHKYSQYLLIGQGRDGRNHISSLVHVYASHNGTHYSKVQEINEGTVLAMYVFYAKPDERDPFVLLRKEETIAIYRLLPSSGFQRHSEIKSSDDLQWATLTNKNYLALYFAPDCDADADQTTRPFIQLLKPRYRQQIAVGHELRAIEWDKLSAQSNSSRASSASETIVN